MTATALSAKPILLVEDDSVDAMTVRRALKEVGSTRQLVHQINGEEALNHLHAADDNELPGLILLDLNMPRMNGLEFLEHKQADDRLRDIPVVVLTTSTNARDIERSYELDAKGYIVKSIDYGNFVDSIRHLDIY
jgi:CheY-like chemotaxis protein